VFPIYVKKSLLKILNSVKYLPLDMINSAWLGRIKINDLVITGQKQQLYSNRPVECILSIFSEKSKSVSFNDQAFMASAVIFKNSFTGRLEAEIRQFTKGLGYDSVEDGIVYSRALDYFELRDKSQIDLTSEINDFDITSRTTPLMTERKHEGSRVPKVLIYQLSEVEERDRS